jgi:hypothetical protein
MNNEFVTDEFIEDIWQQCVRHGLHRGEGKPPILLHDTTAGLSVELDGKVYPMKNRAEVSAFQQKVWADDKENEQRTFE